MVASAAWERREEAGTRPAARGCEPRGEGRVWCPSCLILTRQVGGWQERESQGGDSVVRPGARVLDTGVRVSDTVWKGGR